MIDKVLLFPYYLYLKLRNRAYDQGRKKSVAAEVPTISVGNISVGGTGKTPHTEMILRELLASDEWGGMNLAVLSRGYKRESKGFQQVTADGSATMFGDEPLQIKKKFPGITVAVDKDRVEGCGFLCHPDTLGKKKGGKKCWNKNFPAADLIILDDAFQYRKLKPSLSIVLVSYYKPLDKDHLLPLGSLRDLPERIQEADVIIITKCPYALDNGEKTACAESVGVSGYNAATCTGTARNGKIQHVFFTGIQYLQPVPVFESTESRYTYSKRLILFTGIAKDKPLRNHLSDSYKIVRRFSFPDHHKFSWADFHKIQKAVEHYPTAAIGTTEKDAQRVLDFNGLPQSLKERMLAVPIRVCFFSEDESSLFRKIICNL